MCALDGIASNSLARGQARCNENRAGVYRRGKNGMYTLYGRRFFAMEPVSLELMS